MSDIGDIVVGVIRIADAARKEAERAINESDNPTKVAVVLLALFVSPFEAMTEHEPMALLLPVLVYVTWTAVEIVSHAIKSLLDKIGLSR